MNEQFEKVKYMDNWSRKACADEIREVIMFGESDRELLIRDITEIIDKYIDYRL